MLKKRLLPLLLLASFPAGACYADDGASLQFTVAAPDPVMAGEEVRLQTLAVNTGSTVWKRGTYYWIAEIYEIDGDSRKFLAQTDALSPDEDVPPGAAQGEQLPFQVPDNLQGRRLLYRVFLIKDGKRILATDYRGFQVVEKELRPPIPQDFKVGGDVSFTYKNSSDNSWDGSQAITSANLVGRIKQSSFLFNTYIVHSYNKPVTPTVVLLDYYAPWGTLAAGDISPSLTPLSMDGQGMRGVSYDRNTADYSVTALIGRIVAPQEPGLSDGGRYARYSGGFKAGWHLRPNLTVSADAVLSRDDLHSIAITTDTLLVKPQQNLVYGLNADWRFWDRFSLNSDYQLSSYKADLQSGAAGVGGTAWRQELKYKSGLLTARGSMSRVAPDFYSFASPSVIPDRRTVDAEFGLFPADWTSFSASLNTYTDNLDSDPAKTTTTQTQATVGNMLRLGGRTVLSTSLSSSAAKAKQAGVQDNRTTTLNFSVTQPLGRNTLTAGMQQSEFRDNTHLSHDLSTSLFSFNSNFPLSRVLNLSAGLVDSGTRDKVDSSTARNTSVTGNVSYAMPRRAMAVQCWVTLTSARNDSVQTPARNSSLSVNVETVWVSSQNSRFTFGVGGVSRTDKVCTANTGTSLNLLTRYNYSF